MEKKWVHPFWENAAKDRLTVRLNITHDDGSYSTSVAKVSKFDVDGKITSDSWLLLLPLLSFKNTSIEQLYKDFLKKIKTKIIYPRI